MKASVGRSFFLFLSLLCHCRGQLRGGGKEEATLASDGGLITTGQRSLQAAELSRDQTDGWSYARKFTYSSAGTAPDYGWELVSSKDDTGGSLPQGQYYVSSWQKREIDRDDSSNGGYNPKGDIELKVQVKGLKMDHVYSFWFLIWNNPLIDCGAEGKTYTSSTGVEVKVCTPMDMLNNCIILNNGGIVVDSGSSFEISNNFGTDRLEVNKGVVENIVSNKAVKDSDFFPADFPNQACSRIIPGQLTNIEAAQFIVIARDHGHKNNVVKKSGESQSDAEDRLMHNINGNCKDSSCPFPLRRNKGPSDPEWQAFNCHIDPSQPICQGSGAGGCGQEFENGDNLYDCHDDILLTFVPERTPSNAPNEAHVLRTNEIDYDREPQGLTTLSNAGIKAINNYVVSGTNVVCSECSSDPYCCITWGTQAGA